MAHLLTVITHQTSASFVSCCRMAEQKISEPFKVNSLHDGTWDTMYKCYYNNCVSPIATSALKDDKIGK